MRGLATEFGLTVPKGIGKLEELLELVETDKAFPETARRVFMGLFEQCRALADSIGALDAEIVAHARQDETARRLQTIPGVGPITASLIAATVVDISLFKSARDFAAWLGLVPRQHSTGGKTALVGSPKRATGRSAGCWSSAPRRWFTEPRSGIAPSGHGPERSWSVVLSDWSRSLWLTR